MGAHKESDGHAANDGGNAVLNRLRGMWQFANLAQWIYIFGKAARLDDSIDIEEIEKHCLEPNSTLLAEIAVAILRVVSNHRGLTLDGVDSQAQKQYLAHAPDRNPFGSGETIAKFQDFDIYTKITVLQQFTQWAMIHPERLREKMDEQKDMDQTSWRIEPYGWDSEDRTYFVLDDNRVYRLTEAPPTVQTQPKKKKSIQQYGKRSSKRRRTDRGSQEVAATSADPNDDARDENVQEGLGGMKWECIAISLEQVQSLLEEFRKTRDENERILRQQLEDHLLPILEKQEENRKRRVLQRDRDLANLAKMANAKRSSRIATKVEQQKQEEKFKEEQHELRKAEEARIKEERVRVKQEQQREIRMASRENRLKDREARRRLYTEELANLSAEDGNRAENAAGRASERRIQAEIEKNKQALEALGDEEEDWVFDCICGLFGQVDDGTHSVACETCNIWQHSKCLGISEEEAERPEFQFICKSCHRRQDEIRQRPLIKLKVSKPTESDLQVSPAQTTEAVGSDSTKLARAVDEAPSSVNPDRALFKQPPVASATGIEASLAQEVLQKSHRPASPNNGHRTPNHIQPLVQEPATSLNTEAIVQDKETLDRSPTVSSKTPTSLTRPFHEHKLLPNTAISTPGGAHSLPSRLASEGNPRSLAGISPTKPVSHDSPTPAGSKVSGIASSNNNSASVPSTPHTMTLPPGVTLAPSPQQPILTPPIKHPEPVRPRQNDNEGQRWNESQPTSQPAT